jgi:hypothetical protein
VKVGRVRGGAFLGIDTPDDLSGPETDADLIGRPPRLLKTSRYADYRIIG